VPTRLPGLSEARCAPGQNSSITGTLAGQVEADGRVCECALVEGAGVGRGGADCRAERVAAGADVCAV